MRCVIASRSLTENLPVATPGWLETRTTGNSRSFRMRIARAVPGSNRNSPTERGESGPSTVGTIWLMTPSRSRKTALVTLDLLSKAVDYQVMKQHVDAFDDRCTQLFANYWDCQTVVGHLGHGTAVESTERDHLCAGVGRHLHGANHVLRPRPRGTRP